MRIATWPVYYGWIVLAASAITEMLLQGATSYAAGLFVLPLQAEFHISRADASSSILILFLGSVFAAPIAGRMLDRFPIRPMVCAGAAILTLTFVTIAYTHSLWLMAAALAVPGAVGFVLLGPLTTAMLASRWFTRRRGLALGIAAVATSGGGFTVVPLLSAAIQDHGWRNALYYEAIVMCVIIVLLALFVLRDSPGVVGLAGHPENRGRDGAPDDVETRIVPRVREIMASRAFWIPSLTLALVSGTCQAIVVTLVPYGISLGYAPGMAALLISAFAASAALTKVAAGLLADRIAQRLLLVAAALFMTLSWISVSVSAGYWALFAGACLAGIALGCALPTVAALIAGHFGAPRFATVMGWTYSLICLSAILAVRFIGTMFDRLGNYHAAFMIFAAILAGLLAATLWYATERKTT